MGSGGAEMQLINHFLARGVPDYLPLDLAAIHNTPG